MKRIVIEWSLIFSVGMSLALSSLWVVTRFFDRSSYHLRVVTARSVGDHLHLLVRDGDLSICDQFDVDAAGKVRPLIVDSRKLIPSDFLRGDRLGQFTIPGVDLRYYRIGSDGYVIWSLSLSLLIPGALVFLLAVWLLGRFQRLRRPGESRSGERLTEELASGDAIGHAHDASQMSVPVLRRPGRGHARHGDAGSAGGG